MDRDEKVIGVISSGTPEASATGEEILKKGGNAVDAAVAISFALAVTESPMSGLGGGTQILLSIGNAPPVAINGSTISPKSTPIGIADTLSYHRRSTIPSTVKVLEYAWKNYGSKKITWEELLAPAISLAEKGHKMGPFRAKVNARHRKELQESNYNTSFFLNEDGSVPAEGDILKQGVLASTLKRLARFGAQDFYSGEIARSIAVDMEQHGGWITLEDLQNFPDPVELEPLTIDSKGYTIYTQPPPCGGWTMLLFQNILKKISKDKITKENITEALYWAHLDRKKNPIKDLKKYMDEVATKLNPDYVGYLLDTEREEKDPMESHGETTHFSVVDDQGNAVAVTASINAYFGTQAASKDLGFLYNTYMDDFVFNDSLHPYAVRPNAMAYSSMCPTIVQKNNKNALVIGSPGSSRIISSVGQIVAKWLENNSIVSQVGEPRIHVSNDHAYLENVDDSLAINSILKKYTLDLVTPREDLASKKDLNPYYGGVHAIAMEKGKWVGVADPRRDGKVIKVTK